MSRRSRTYVVFIDLDADVEHLAVGVGIGVVAADDFVLARERRVRHTIVLVVGRPSRQSLHTQEHQRHHHPDIYTNAVVISH